MMNFGSMTDKIPGMGAVAGKIEIPDCERSKEYGVHQDKGAFDGLHDSPLEDTTIESIVIQSGGILDGIIVTYADGASVRYGGTGGGSTKIVLAGDSVSKISGVSHANFGGRRLISQLCIETSAGKKYGPFGGEKKGTAFTIESKGKKLAAFFGSADGGYISSLGGYWIK